MLRVKGSIINKTEDGQNLIILSDKGATIDRYIANTKIVKAMDIQINGCFYILVYGFDRVKCKNFNFQIHRTDFAMMSVNPSAGQIYYYSKYNNRCRNTRPIELKKKTTFLHNSFVLPQVKHVICLFLLNLNRDLSLDGL